MKRTTNLAPVVVLSAILLGGCASQPQSLRISVTDVSFSIGDREFKTRAELAEAIRLAGATECRVMPSATAAYKQVETAVLAVQDAGCRSGIIGDRQP